MGLDVYLVKLNGKLNEYGMPDSDNLPETKDKRYPKHSWNLGYLRSNYNCFGFNTVIDRVTGKRGLYYIFDVTDTELDYQNPNWEESLKRAKEVKELLAPAKFDAIPAFWHENEDLTEENVLQEFLKRYTEGGGDYSCKYGEFFLSEPLRVHAIMTGTGFMGGRVFIVHEKDFTHYLQALDIVIAFIENAIALNDENLRLWWSN